MGKILSIVGMIFGVVGFIAAVLIFMTLSGLPAQMGDTATLELSKLRTSLNNIDNVTTTMDGTFDGLNTAVASISSSMETSGAMMITLGNGLDKLADDLTLAGINVVQLRSSATALKNTDMAAIRSSASGFSTKVTALKDSIKTAATAINSTKLSIVHMQSTMEDLSSTMSRAILFLGLFLIAISLALVAFSWNVYSLQSKLK